MSYSLLDLHEGFPGIVTREFWSPGFGLSSLFPAEDWSLCFVLMELFCHGQSLLMVSSRSLPVHSFHLSACVAAPCPSKGRMSSAVSPCMTPPTLIPPATTALTPCNIAQGRIMGTAMTPKGFQRLTAVGTPERSSCHHWKPRPVRCW